MNITRDDVTAEHGTAAWGGPTAKVTINAGPLTGRAFWLRSTQGLAGDTGNVRNGGGIHVDGVDPDSRHHDWRGAFKTYDMSEAIGFLVDYVNSLAARTAVREATWSETSAVADAFEAFTDALSESSPREWREEWQRVQAAVRALDMKTEEASA